MFWVFLICALIILLTILYIRQFKRLKVPSVYFVTGGVKTGKSFCTCWIAMQKYYGALIRYFFVRYIVYFIFNYFITYVLFLFTKCKKMVKPMRPMLYSNIPLANVKYNKLTLDIIRRRVRIPNKSVCIIDEASLIADSMSYKDDLLNEEVALFIKLFGHYSHGGFLVYNSQDLKDMHYGFKRCTNSMLYIHSKLKLPFITILKVRELISIQDDEVQTENNFNEDIEKSCLYLVIPNKYYFMYDCYTFSQLTDDKPYQVNYIVKKVKSKRFKRANLKTRFVLSFRNFKSFKNTEDKQ